MNNVDILNSIQDQIKYSDSKATTLISAVGVVFGFSLFGIDYFIEKAKDNKLLIVAGITYLSFFLLCVLLLVLVIFPRGKNKKDKKKDTILFYEDIYKHAKDNDVDSFISNGITELDIKEQIIVCAKIAHTKNSLVRIASILLVGFVASLVFLVIAFVV